MTFSYNLSTKERQEVSVQETPTPFPHFPQTDTQEKNPSDIFTAILTAFPHERNSTSIRGPTLATFETTNSGRGI